LSERSTATEAPLGTALPNLGPIAYLIDTTLRIKEGASVALMECFHGRTPVVDDLEFHYSVLKPGGVPHPPHAHREEEILVVMSGSAELVVPTPERSDLVEIFPAPAGTAIYYPSFQHHTIHNAGADPVTYAMLRWTSAAGGAEKPLMPCLLQAAWLRSEAPSKSVAMVRLLEGPTAFLGKLHAHATRIQPGGGYDVHRDDHDGAIFLLEGEIAILGHVLKAPAVSFMPAGAPHDMRNIGTAPAQYLVWEFHKDGAHRSH